MDKFDCKLPYSFSPQRSISIVVGTCLAPSWHREPSFSAVDATKFLENRIIIKYRAHIANTSVGHIYASLMDASGIIDEFLWHHSEITLECNN